MSLETASTVDAAEADAAEADADAVEADAERHASWLELFFDLLFVALVSQLVHQLHAVPQAWTLVKVAGLFIAPWWAWGSFVLLVNMGGEPVNRMRLYYLSYMACLLLMAGGIEGAMSGDPTLYAVGYLTSRVLNIVLWRLMRRRSLVVYVPALVSMALWAVSLFVGSPVAYVLWGISMVVEIVMGVRFVTMVSVHMEHLIERFGLFVIIVLGEGVVQLVTAISAAHGAWPTVTTGMLCFVILAALWTLYFDFAVAAGQSRLLSVDSPVMTLARDLLLAGHYLIVGAMLMVSAGLGLLVSDTADGHRAGAGVALVCAGLVLYVATNVFLAVVRLREPVWRVLGWSAGPMVVLTAVGLYGRDLSPMAGAALIALAMIGAVVVSGVKRARVRARLT